MNLKHISIAILCFTCFTTRIQAQKLVSWVSTSETERWTSLSSLPAKDRENIMKELFNPEGGANFTVCRMPIGANDFARKWYSYNETEGDFAMENFSIKNDFETLIPFIKTAQT